MNEHVKANVKRLLACIAGGLVLALMVGDQEGSDNDFGIAFRQAILGVRVIWFILIGVVIYLLITFWPLVKPFIRRPGVTPLVGGTLSVLVAQFVMNWFDPLPNAASSRFNAVASAVDGTSGLFALTRPFFDYLSWVLLALTLVLTAVSIISRVRILGYLGALVGLLGAVLAYVAHDDVASTASALGPDHSLGVYVDVIGFLLFVGAGITAARARAEAGNPRAFVQGVLDWRPGFAIAVLGVLWGLIVFSTSAWFSPTGVNWGLSATSTNFEGTGVGGLATQYLAWLGWTLLVVCTLLTVGAAYFRNEIVAWVGMALSVIAVVLTFFTLQAMTSTAARVAPQYGTEWNNLGVGGFIACLAFSIMGAAMVQTASAARSTRRLAARAGIDPKVAEEVADRGDENAVVETAAATKGAGTIVLPITAAVRNLRRSASNRALLLIAIAVALFYPPTLPTTWQNVIVGQIGVYLLLAVGLNVVVGWAGLLDLGYIAFYEIGAYTTAYLVGVLPVKPPTWLHWFNPHGPGMNTFVAIPFAVIACLIAGVLLGAPTLRLRGDYLAIVTLGFGEIIQVVAINNPGGFTGGPVGPTVPHPVLHIGGLHITFGQDNLPYWYLLLIMIVIIAVLFYRLEGSRIGRAWAAIREDEIAAQASGVRTMRVKLLAFAIGASTSGLAGWFFSTQVGYFDPTLFTLQASILIVAYVVFGGMGSLAGAMAGAAALTWLPQFLKTQVPQADRQMWVGALVLAMMIFRPAGLLPAKRRRAELEGLDLDEQTEAAAVPRAGAV